MSSLGALVGQPVIARDSAERMGTVDGVVLDPTAHSIVAVQLGAKKSSRFVGWEQINAVGVDAVMVSSAADVREAQGPLEERAAAGIASLLCKLVLGDGGDALGTVDDVEFDQTTGIVQLLRTGDEQVDGERIIGIGSYAVVINTDLAEATDQRGGAHE